jgi:DNA-binding MarR family transcriptional regulator
MTRVERKRALTGASAVADQLHSAAIHLLRKVRQQDREAGVGPARLSALSILVFRGPMTLGELAVAEQVKPPTVTRIVAGLEAEGLAKRQADEKDARVVRLRATSKGVRLMQEARRRRIRDLADRLRTLSEAELEALRRAAEIIERVVS